MIRNYLKIAFRSLMRSKGHSAINIFGLSIGVCCCLLIGLFVEDELTFDRFHSKADRIYRAYVIEDWGENQRFINMATPFPLGPALKTHLEEVERMVRINNISSQVKTESADFSEQVTIVGVDFLKMFDFEMLRGQSDNALNDQTSLLLTEETAKRFFGEADPLGKNISLFLKDRFEEFTVTGVLRNPPGNSSIQFGILISDLNYPKLYSDRVLTSQWFNISPETYIELRGGVTPESVSGKFPAVFKPLVGENYEKSKYFVGLQRLTAIHLDTSLPAGNVPLSNPRYSYILSAVAMLILLVACINFVTLSLGRSLRRAREVGIRKVAGAQRGQLIFQFIGEAVIMTSISLLIGIALAGLCLPVFNDLSGKQLSVQTDQFLLLSAVSLVIIIGVVAGSYPALILSAFKPVTVLKGVTTSGNNKQQTRKILVGIQIVLAIFLISSTVVMKRQMQFLQNKNLGFDKENLVVVPLDIKTGRSIGQGISSAVQEGFAVAQQFKAELAKLPQISGVCAASHDIANGSWAYAGFTDDAGAYRNFYFNSVNEDFIETMKIEVVAGRAFSSENPSDNRRAVMVNEAFVEYFGWHEAVGKRIPGKQFPDHEIIGVIQDFNYTSLYTKVTPLVMVMDPVVLMGGIENINIDNSMIPKMLIRLRPGNVSATVGQIKEVWDRLTGGKEFEFSFVDERLMAQYRRDQNLEKIISIATVLALIIGCLGLYGLASLAMQNRTKEISIRKVLGATRSSILVLLSKDYALLVIACLVLSIPLTWYIMREWLTTFEYRIDIGVDVFLIAGGLCLLVMMLTISYEGLMTASRKPAETLKCE